MKIQTIEYDDPELARPATIEIDVEEDENEDGEQTLMARLALTIHNEDGTGELAMAQLELIKLLQVREAIDKAIARYTDA